MSATSGLCSLLFAVVSVNNLNMDGCVLQVDQLLAIENIFLLFALVLAMALVWQVAGTLTKWLVSSR